MASRHICPRCGGTQFYTTAYVSQSWLVDDVGNYISCSSECDGNVLYPPDDGNIWECANCGAEAVIVREPIAPVISAKAKNAEKLIADIGKKLAKWNERSCFRMKGASGLSKADMDMLLMYAQAIRETDSYSGYMEPRGGVRDVLVAYGLV